MNVVERISNKKVLHWFRKDLRVFDHEVLSNHNRTHHLTCFYIHHSRYTTYHPLGFPFISDLRKSFLEQALTELQDNLHNLEIELIIFNSNEDFEKYEFDEVDILTYQKQFGSEELLEEDQVLGNFTTEFHSFNSFTLIEETKLPFDVNAVPNTFATFRKKIEERPIYKSPIKDNNIPKVQKSPFAFYGGSKSALSRLQSYFEGNLPSTYKKTRNQLLGTQFSSRLSAWLAIGNITPRYVLALINQYEHQVCKNDSTYWLKFELLWRDFFQFQLIKYNTQFFKLGGIKEKVIQPLKNRQKFWQWANGKTGDDFVDANMIELNSTGWMSNRGRQNTASYLVHDMNLDWRWGAYYFESKLIDYDVASNWGNWQYIAGVGNDPRPFRKFNTQLQASRYDANGDYRNYWLKT